MILSGILFLYVSGFYEQLSFENIQRNLDAIKSFHGESPVLMTLSFLLIYVLITALSIPGAIVLTLLSGAVYGTTIGTLIVSIASCIGATIAFIMSRYMFRDYLTQKYEKKFKEIDRKFRAKGKMYLFSLRMIPVSPFVVINVVMGLTSIRLWTYVWITFVGMIPGTFIYVYAGRRISEISSPGEILNWQIITILTLLGLMPLAGKFFSKGKKWEHVHGS